MDDDDELTFLGSISQLSSTIAVCYWGFLAIRWCCCRRCGRNNPPGAVLAEVKPVTSVLVDGQTIPVEFLTQKKELKTACWLWFFTGLLGTHHFYLGRLVHGCMAMWSFNFLGFGWLIDALCLRWYVQIANGKTAPMAHSDRSCATVCKRGCVTSCIVMGLFVVIICKTPRTIHELGFIDLDQRIAKTESNPFDVLGVPRNTQADVPDVDASYSTKSGMLKQGRGCDKACEKEKKELKKAYDFIKGSWREKAIKRGKSKKKNARRPKTDDDDDWSDWSDFVKLEWDVLGEVTKKGFTDFYNKFQEENSTSSNSDRHQERQRDFSKYDDEL